MKHHKMTPNSLYYGDCLEVVEKWPDESVDLIYLDPPFKSNAKYNQTFGKENGVPTQVRAFEDTWKWGPAAAERTERIKTAYGLPHRNVIEGLDVILGPCGMLAYLTYMSERLYSLKRLLKPTGSIYLHCDPTSSHYLKLLMDGIFSAKHFRNEIVWFYDDAPGRSESYYPKKHDIIFWYSKTNKWTFNGDAVRIPIKDESKDRFKYERKIGGKSYLGGESSKKGKIPEDVWKSPVLKKNSKESLGYDTQKPIALLRRIITAATNPMDLVLDPFVGGGTSVDVAHRTGRSWIGIDISPRAIELITSRRMEIKKESVFGIPTDMEGAKKLLRQNPYDFEAWAVAQIEGLSPNAKQTGDKGCDGRGCLASPPEGEKGLVVAQVKGGKYKAGDLRDFLHVLSREKATAAVFITMNKMTNRNALAEAAKKGCYAHPRDGSRHPRVQFWSIEEHFNGVKPDIPHRVDPDKGVAKIDDMVNEMNEGKKLEKGQQASLL